MVLTTPQADSGGTPGGLPPGTSIVVQSPPKPIMLTPRSIFSWGNMDSYTHTKQFEKATTMPTGFKRFEVSAATSEKVLNWIRPWSISFNTSRFLTIPTAGIGTIRQDFLEENGIKKMNVDLSGWFDMVKEYSHYSTSDVMAYMAWVMGDDSSAVRKKYDDPKKHMMYPLDTTLTGNHAKVVLFKVQMRQVAQVLYYALKNAMTEDAYKSFALQEKKFMYNDAETQDIIWDGFTFLSLVLEVIKPDTVVQVKSLETQFKAITLASCKGCFRTLVTTLENKAAEINEVAGEVRVSNNMLLTQVFETAEKASNEAFKMDLSIAKSSWVTGKQTDKDVIIGDLTKLYVNKQDEGTWTTGSEKDQKIIALTTQVSEVKKTLNALKSVHFKQGTPPGTGRSSAGKAAKADAWKFEFKGKTKEVDGTKYEWCRDHGSGMYMPSPHDHSAWKKRKAEKKEAWEARRQKRDKKGPSDHTKAAGSSKTPSKLTLGKNLRASLVTHFHMSAGEADQVFNEAYDESLKE